MRLTCHLRRLYGGRRSSSSSFSSSSKWDLRCSVRPTLWMLVEARPTITPSCRDGVSKGCCRHVHLRHNLQQRWRRPTFPPCLVVAVVAAPSCRYLSVERIVCRRVEVHGGVGLAVRSRAGVCVAQRHDGPSRATGRWGKPSRDGRRQGSADW